MAVYRLADGANAGDVTKATNLLEASRPSLVNMGYTELRDPFVFTVPYVQFQMNRPRERWGFALNNAQTTLDAFIETIIARDQANVLSWGLFGWRQGLGLQATRTARDNACKKVIEAVPPTGWIVRVPGVAVGAPTVVTEYLVAKFGAPTIGLDGRSNYETTIEALRIAAGVV